MVSTETDYDKSRNDGFLRIWELELVISGAVIVGLFQVPSAIDSLFNQIAPHISNEVSMLPFMFYYLGKLLLYPLITTFMLHFFLRGFWVGLIGLASIFPDGIIWERLKLPPVQERFLRGCQTQLKQIQKNIDRVCSSLFSVLFVFLLIFLWLGILSLISVPLSLFLKRTMWTNTSLNVIFISTFYAIIALFFGPAALASLFDKYLKKKPALQGRFPKMEKIMQIVYRSAHVASLGFMYVPLIMVFRSNMKKGRALAGYFFLVFLFPCVFAGSFLISQGIIDFQSYRYFPLNESDLGMRAVHYENLREYGSGSRVPSIQSDMIQDRYIKLFLPFNTRKDNKRMREQCPDLEPYRSDGFVLPMADTDENRNDRILTCLAKLYTVDLNGTLLDTLRFSFYTHPQTRVRGILTYIPVSLGDEGKNMLTITRKKLRKDLEKESKDEELKRKNRHRGIWYIPFWM